MKNFRKEFQMIEYMIGQLCFEPNITLVVGKEYLTCILDSIDFETKTFTKEVDSEYYTYMIEKYEDIQGNIHVEVIPVKFDDDGLVSTEIDNEYVIVQENVLDEDDIAQIYADEELTIINYEYEMGVDLANDECCQSCCNCNDEENNEDTEIVEEYIESKVVEFLELLEENEDNKEFCFPCAIREMLEQVYCTAYEDGKKELALSLGNLLGEIVEE